MPPYGVTRPQWVNLNLLLESYFTHCCTKMYLLHSINYLVYLFLWYIYSSKILRLSRVNASMGLSLLWINSQRIRKTVCKPVVKCSLKHRLSRRKLVAIWTFFECHLLRQQTRKILCWDTTFEFRSFPAAVEHTSMHSFQLGLQSTGSYIAEVQVDLSSGWKGRAGILHVYFRKWNASKFDI